MECNELDDSSCTPPVSPGKMAQTLECTNEMKGFEKPSSSEEPKMNMKKVIPEKNVPLIDCIQQSDEEIVLIESSPDENKHQILDYDDENDKNFVGAEVSLSAAAGDSDQGDLSVLEPFPQVEITEIASPLDSQEYILFSSDVVDYAVDSDDSLKPISFIQKDDSVVISYSRQTSESNGESNMHSPLEGSEDENNCIHTDEIIEKSSPTQTEKNSIQIEDVNHESIDSEIVVISSNVGSPEEHIATEEDFEELIDSGKPEDSPEGEIKESPSEKISLSQTDPPTSTVTRTETTKKTVAVISLAAKPPQSVSGLHQFKIVNTGKPGTGIARLPLLSAVISPHSNTKILNEVSQATVASVSIANQTISVPVLKSLNVPIVPLSSSSQGNLSPVSHLKKVPITITASSLNLPSKPISSVISVISSNIPRMAPFNPVITLATTNPSTTSRMPIPIITQKHIQQKIVKALDKPTTLTISSSKLSSLAVSQDVTLPAKIFQDESASPDSSLSQDESNENDGISSELSVHKDKATKDVLLQSLKKPINTLPQKSVCSANQNMALASQSLLISNADHSVKTKDVDIENEITKHTELPQKSLLLSKLDIPKSPERISEKIPDNIMEGDDEKVTKSDECEEPSKYLVPNLTMQTESVGDSNAKDSSILSNMKTNNLLNANPSKDMVLDSNMGISSELTQDSIQISIPSPTSSQERYLDNITLQAHNTELNNTVSISQKQVQQFKEMIDIWNNISGEPKVYPIKLQDHNLNSPQESSISAMLNRDNDSISDIDDIIRQDLNNSITTKPEHNQEALKSTIPVHVIMRTRESSQSPITVATSRITTVMPQLSPLSKPTELTTNIANASQQLRTIMSSINTSKVESTVNSTVTFMKKGPSQDLGTTTQVNFENLLPSTKVEVMAGKCTNRGLIEKAVLNSINSTTENSQSISSIIATSRISSLTTSAAGNINRNQHSPLQSPSGSPRHSPLLPAKSPIHSPLLMGQSVSEEQPNITSQTPPINQQAIQMPALSKIPTNSSQALSTVIQTNVPNSTTSILHKNQLITTNILSSTLLQTAGRHNQNNMQIPVHSLSQPPALIMSSRPATILSTNQISNLTTSNTNSITITSLAQSIKTQSGSNIISSKLLHSQLTSPLKRSKSTDEPKTEITSGQMQPNKRHSLESVIVKSEPMDCDDINSGLQSLENSGCKFSSLNLPQKPDESQNVLLKQLLQSSGGNSPTVTPARTSVSSLLSKQRTAPTLGLVPSLEAQLARPLIPPPHLPITTTVEPAKTSPRQTVSRETSFVPRMPQATSAPMVVTSVPMTTQSSTHSLMDVRKPPNKPIIKEEPPSTPTTTTPTTPMSISSFTLTGNEILSPTIKKEVIAPQQSPVNQPFVPLEVKKELLDESSQQSAISGISTVSDQGKLDTPLKEELSDTPNNIDTPIESGTNQETALEAKKRKRREYQQKRRQMQNNQKIEANNNKKRPRKGSKVEEDYDTYIDSLMNQLRQLPPMQVQEPMLGKNYGVCPVFGSGDLSKIGIMKDYSIKYGDLNGEFGNAYIPNITDFYNTKPFGEEESIPEKPPISTQRGFYDQEFSPIRLDSENDEKKMEFICKERDIDTPDTIVSSSSPECCVWDNSYPFPGLKLIDESESDEEVERSSSPIIPIITPIPIRVKSHQCDIPQKEMEKENVSANVNKEMVSIKSKVIGTGPSTENEENVTVTLTLTSAAAEDILGVLRELAGILHIPPPTAYQIVERTTTPPSHKLGLYRSKGKDGKEGAPIDIQSILNGEAKFCRHCDVVIMDSVIKAKASEFPLLSSFKSTSNDLLGDVESDLFFCSTQCYKRFAWTPTNIIVDNKSNMKFQENENSIIPNMDIKVKDDFDAGSVESMDTEDVDLKPSIKGEKIDLSFMDSIDNEDLVKHGDEMGLKMEEDSNSEIKLDEKVIKEELMDKDDSGPPSKLFRGMQYKFWSPGCIVPPTRYKKPSDREITEMVFRTGVTVMPARLPDDLRKCSLCHSQGDGIADGPARLLNYDVDKWVHLNCALWSDGVYETVNGALMNFDNVLQTCSTSTCVFCERNGATVRCFKTRCTNIYHLSCAVKHKCVFHKNKTAHCPSHIPKGEKENELTTLSVQRRVYVQRDESRQVAAVMQLAEPTYLLRVGGLIFLSVGQLLPHQLPAFHSPNYIYPIGYQTIRFYWSTKRINTRCRYICSIVDKGGRPEFVVTPQEGEAGAAESRGSTPRGAWAPLLNALSSLRATQDTLRLWPDHLTGEDLFGLTEPAIVRVLESLPGIDTLTDYRFKYGRNPLLELPLAVNPSGAARTEARAAARGAQWRRALAVRAPPPAPRLPALPLAPPPPPGEHACPYSKQFVHSKSSQYKKMKQEWRNNVYLARSKIQGLGLYAARDIEKHTMVIEYIGEVIRSELSEIREKKYEDRNRGIYMFRLDEERVVDATLSGGLARYINHSCNPNCVAEAVEVERDLRIIIFAKRRINRGEELAYDYKFDIEDDAHKISCMCGAPNCRKWMN